MKLNNKGFMMAEVVVVSAVVLIALTSLYVSYNSIYSAYSKRLAYNDVSILYSLSYYNDYLSIKRGGHFLSRLDVAKDMAKNSEDKVFIINSSIVETYNGIDKYISDNYLVCSDENKCEESLVLFYIDNKSIKLTGVSSTFSDFVDYTSSLVSSKSDTYVLLMEKCDSSSYGLTNCKYAYMEV